MTLIDRLLTVPQRENAGSRTTQRFDYQALWGLTLLFKHYDEVSDYAVCFEFHDDVVLLDDSANPKTVRFYQVKTKEKGTWSLTDLSRRKKKKDSDELLPSYLGNLQHNFENFPDETKAMVFVSNVPCSLFAGITGTGFAEIEKTEFEKFLKKLKAERPKANKESASLMHFEVADLSLNDASTHLKGKLNNLVVKQLGEITYNLDGLYRTVVEECRLRSKYVGTYSSLSDLLEAKTITKAQLTSWLDSLKFAHFLPQWDAIANDLALPAMEKAALAREWASYRAEALDQGNEAQNKLRDSIRKALASADSTATLLTLLTAIESIVKPDAQRLLPTLKPARLKTMILYEVHLYDPSGSI